MADDLGSTEREIVAQRIKKAEALRKLAVNPYGNGFTPRHLARDLKARYGSQTAEEIARDPETWSVAGRCLAVRSFGKAAFLRVRDRSGDLQVWVKKDKVGERGFEVFQLLDVGDVVAAEGPATRTKTGELTVEAAAFTILTKAIRPLPEKWHGLADVEARYRQRYLDLVVTEGVRQNFERRAAIVRTMPNTPALIGRGVTGMAATARVSGAQRELAESILRTAGDVVWFDDEAKLDAVTAVSGSGPAYVFYFIEALARAGTELGFTAEQARELAVQTFVGAAQLAAESAEPLATLRQRVTSKGGTTAAALAWMEANAVEGRIVQQYG